MAFCILVSRDGESVPVPDDDGVVLQSLVLRDARSISSHPVPLGPSGVSEIVGGRSILPASIATSLPSRGLRDVVELMGVASRSSEGSVDEVSLWIGGKTIAELTDTMEAISYLDIPDLRMRIARSIAIRIRNQPPGVIREQFGLPAYPSQSTRDRPVEFTVRQWLEGATTTRPPAPLASSPSARGVPVPVPVPVPSPH